MQLSEINQVSYQIIGAAIRIHRHLGSGLLESAYHDLLGRDLTKQGFFIENKKRVGFLFEGSWVENELTTDLIVERQIVVELKVAQAIAKVHERQLLTYVRLLNLPLGLLINFGGPVLYTGIRRFINT
jgi:GxxExxY protein